MCFSYYVRLFLFWLCSCSSCFQSRSGLLKLDLVTSNLLNKLIFLSLFALKVNLDPVFLLSLLVQLILL